MTAANQDYRLTLSSSDLLADNVNAIEYSPDGKLLSAADVRGSLVTFDVTVGAAIHFGYLGPQTQIFCLVWSSNSELFFGCTNGVVASLQLVKTGSEVNFPWFASW